MGVGADDEANIAPRGHMNALQVHGLVGARVDDDVAAAGITHQIGVGAGAAHHAGVGGRQAHQVFTQRHGLFVLPVQVMNTVAVGQHHFQLAIGHVGFGVARIFALQVAAARAGLPQWFFALQCVDERLRVRQNRDSLQRTQGGEEDEQLFLLKALHRILWANPGGLELLGFIGHRCLPFRHTRYKKRDVEALWQVKRRCPVRQVPELIDGQRPAALAALLIQRCMAVQLLHLCGGNGLARFVIGQQDAQLFKRLANAGQSLRDAFIATYLNHAGAHASQRVVGRVGILIFQSAAGEYIGIGKNSLVGAPCHQYFKAIGTITQQQDSRGLACGHRIALGLKKLTGAGLAGWGHELNYAKCAVPLDAISGLVASLLRVKSGKALRANRVQLLAFDYCK